MAKPALLLLGLLPSAALAQELLDPIVITANRNETKRSEAPYTTEYLDHDFIEENTRRTLPDALQFTPGVLVQKTSPGHGSPYIRGFTGRQNLLMVDGVRVNNSIFRSGPVQYWNTVDPLAIDHLELIKSQGSVLYGSDAVGGTLNTFMQAPSFRAEPEGQAYTHGSAYYEYRSNGDDSNIGRLQVEAGLGDRFGLLLGISQKDFGDIEDSGIGIMPHTGYPEQDLDGRLDIAVTPDSTITLAHYNVNQDEIWRWHSTYYNPGWQHDGHVVAPGTWPARIYDQERSISYLRYAGEDPRDNAAIKRWSATVSFQTTNDREFQFRAVTPRIDRRYQLTDVDTTGFDLELESPLGPGSLVYGVDYYHDSVGAEGWRDRGAGAFYDPSFRPVADDSSYDLFGAFAQYVWKPVERLDITGGMRYTYARAELGRYWDSVAGVDRYDASQSWDDLLGSLRALYRLNDCWSLYGGISQSFRAPNLDDLSGNLTARSGTTSLGSTDLEPEKFLTYEIGTRYTTEKATANFSIFYTDIDDAIVGVPVTSGGATTVAANGRDGYVYGVEVEGAWRFADCWTLSGFAAWQDGRTDTAAFVGGPLITEPGSRLLPLTGSVALRWTHSSGDYWVEGRVLAAAEENRLTASDRADNQRIPSGGTPGYVAAMLHAGWKVSRNVELTCGLENLTDIDYRNHGSGQNEPGFNAILGAKVLW